MSLASPPDRQASPAINLSSNNPFRNRAVSPAVPSPTGSFPKPRTPALEQSNLGNRNSTNPFLDDPSDLPLQRTTTLPETRNMSPQKPTFTGNTAELFDNLTLDDKPAQSRRPAPPRPENVPPQIPSSSTKPAHRPSRSQEEERRRRQQHSSRGQLDIFADPNDQSRDRERERARRAARRNSESSVMEKPRLTEDEERRRRERHRRERERRHREREGKSSSSTTKPKGRLDVIDKLDVTSIYGTGLFHHDGPFDACNPHRNRKGMKTAPMQAFPKDSRNMALGGSGPNNSNIDLAQFHGRGEEGYNDFSTSAKPPAPVVAFDPKGAEIAHGEESAGLGTSTFLEGAPASRTAIQRRESESDTIPMAGGNIGGGLARKKSLAQKIRGISNQRSMGPSGRITSPEPVFESRSPASGGGSARIGKDNNPFFQDYDSAYEQKGAKIQQAESGAAAPGSPRRMQPGLERRVTTDSAGFGGDEPKASSSGGGGGFLNRMKSLKGGPRRAKTVRQQTGDL